MLDYKVIIKHYGGGCQETNKPGKGSAADPELMVFSGPLRLARKLGILFRKELPTTESLNWFTDQLTQKTQ